MTTPQRIRRFWSHWQPWMVLFGAAVIFTMVALWFFSGRTARIVSERHADVVANAEAQFQQCRSSIPQLTKINRFIRGVQLEHETLLTNSIANHAATPEDSPVYKTQIANIARLRKANDAVKNVRFNVPTRQECRDLKAMLLQQ